MRDSVYLARHIPAFVMYCVNGESGSSLLIESTDSLTYNYYYIYWYIYIIIYGGFCTAAHPNNKK